MSFFDKYKKHTILNDNWEFYQTFDEDEKVMYITIDLTYQEIENQKGFEGELFIRIRIPSSRLYNEIPTPEELQFQNDKEEELCNALINKRVKCIQVGRLTFAGQKQYIFEYNDLDGFQKVYNNWKKSFSEEYVIELNLLNPFEYYSELLPDKYIWQQIGNGHVIEKLLSAGSDESKEHFIEHGIFGNNDDLKRLYDEIKEFDFTLLSAEGDLIEIGTTSSIELDDITNQTNYLIDISEKYNCRYDGWVTAIVK